MTTLVKNEQNQVGLREKNVGQKPQRHGDMFSLSDCATASPQGRRTTHISAEQKRRTHIKFGFKTLCGLVPTLKSQSNVRDTSRPLTSLTSLTCCVFLLDSHHCSSPLSPSLSLQTSNAVTLQKTVEHIGKLQTERQQVQEEVKRLREEIEELNTSIRWRWSHSTHPKTFGSGCNDVFFVSVLTMTHQLVSGTAARHRGSHQAAALRSQPGVQRVREEPDAAELEVLDRILHTAAGATTGFFLHMSRSGTSWVVLS